MNRRVRIADVARLAGVSTASVSRTLSSPEQVSRETRERVMTAVRATGYRINGAARDLRQRRARSILILAPNLANTFFSRIFAAVQEEAERAGLTVQISDSRVAPDRLAALGFDGRTDGIMLLDGSLDPALVNAWTLPVVQLCEWNAGYDAPGLIIDNVAAAGLAVDHLVALGHRKLLHVEGPRENILGRTRREGFEKACMAQGAVPHVMEGGFTLDAGAGAARRWSALRDAPTAVFCASDECALGFISECHRLGIDVPGDVSVIGFDDIDFADRFIPALTTIRQPRDTIGREGFRLLLDMLSAEGPRARDIARINAELVPRATTATPSATR